MQREGTPRDACANRLDTGICWLCDVTPSDDAGWQYDTSAVGALHLDARACALVHVQGAHKTFDTVRNLEKNLSGSSDDRKVFQELFFC